MWQNFTLFFPCIMIHLLKCKPASAHTSFIRESTYWRGGLTIDLCNCSLPDDGPVRLETCSSLSLLKHLCDVNEVCASVGSHCNKCGMCALNSVIHFQTCISMQNVELFREKRSVIMLVFYIVIRITRRTRTVSELSSDQGLRAGAALGAEILNCEAD